MAPGYNKAFREARSEWVCWLNDDVEVVGDTLDRAVRWMVDHPEIGMGALYYAEGSGPGAPWHVNEAWGVGYANFGILRRELGNLLGWFDPDVSMYGSDNSLTFKVLLAGKGVVGIPGTRLIHHAQADAQKQRNVTTQPADHKRLFDRYEVLMPLMRQQYARFAKAQGPMVVPRTERWGEDATC